MNLYFAPMEGITTYTYRNTHQEFFGGVDAYFAPFITPSDNERLSMKCLRDINPENNKVNLVPQVLTNVGESFLKFEEMIKPLGYEKVNINLGCPSGTVVKKGRGSGFLKNPEGIDEFLEYVFEHTGLRVSVKSRSGFWSGDELEGLMKIYNKYPLETLIIHPRTREAFYSGEPDLGAFAEAEQRSVNPICFNGNIFSVTDYERIRAAFPRLEGVMLGRGAIANPALFREIRGGAPLSCEELLEFTNALAEKYLTILGSEVYTLHKLKEIWLYMMWSFPEEKKIFKAVKKANKLCDLLGAISQLPPIKRS